MHLHSLHSMTLYFNHKWSHRATQSLCVAVGYCFNQAGLSNPQFIIFLGYHCKSSLFSSSFLLFASQSMPCQLKHPSKRLPHHLHELLQRHEKRAICQRYQLQHGWCKIHPIGCSALGEVSVSQFRRWRCSSFVPFKDTGLEG